jgi:crotonyl-CoA reductase
MSVLKNATPSDGAGPLAISDAAWAGRLPIGNVPPMDTILEAIQSGASGDDIANLPIPDHFRAAFVQRDDVAMFEGVASDDKDPRKSIHIGDVATPDLAPDEVYLAVMASSINFNTVWTSIFEPLPTFGFLDRLGRESEWGARHAQDF